MRGRPWYLVYSKIFPSRQEAQYWEGWLKRQKCREIVEQIVSLQLKE